MDIYKFWADVLRQDKATIRSYFHEDAYVNWHCTNEHFTVDEFIRANCEYPGEWDGEVERIENIGERVITATHVYTKDGTLSFHVTSFFTILEDKIVSVDEYWADDGPAPRWRLDMRIGGKIR